MQEFYECKHRVQCQDGAEDNCPQCWKMLKNSNASVKMDTKLCVRIVFTLIQLSVAFDILRQESCHRLYMKWGKRNPVGPTIMSEVE